MKINYNTNSTFPSQVVSDGEKATWEYGTQVAQAIEQEWFNQGRTNGNRYLTTWNNYNRLRLYARGEQPVDKYKDELSINGDLSYLNLDWKPVPIISKFVDILVNGISNKNYEINAFAQDPESLEKRTNYAEMLAQDIFARETMQQIVEKLDSSLFNTTIPESKLPEDETELELHMQLNYKQAIEIAEEEVINQVLDTNRWELTKRRVNYDLVTCGIGACKTNFNLSNGVTVDYVDPAYLIYSYTEDPNFEDIYYVGELKPVTLPEIAKQFPRLDDATLEKIQQQQGNRTYMYGYGNGPWDQNTIPLLYFEYKTYSEQVFKIKETEYGLEKALEKPDTFNPPENDNFDRVGRTIETLYRGVKVLGTDIMLRWEMCPNMTRPKADTTKVEMNYAICAPRMYKGRIESTVGRITGFADMIQITHLKLQQVIARMVPDGVFLDMDGLAEVDLGNGTNYNPAEALNMYFQTGSIVGRSLTQEGDMNPGKVPIQELQTSSGQGKIASLIQTYQYYLQMIRDVTGLNEARDGSMPEKDTLIGLQKMAVNASNTATRHVMQASLWLTIRTCENISLKVADSLKNPLTLNSLKSSISTYNVATLAEIQNLPLHDFGIYLELEPEEEEKAMLEQNIQMALQQGGIDLEDAIDVRRIKNLKLANDVLKQKRKEKQKMAQQQQMQVAQAQEQAKAQAAQAIAEAEVQKQQALTAANVQYEQAKAQMELQKIQQQAQLKKEEMEIKHMYDLELKRMEVDAMTAKENMIEDRKDKRTKMEGTQQSKMIEQRKMNLMPTDFENNKGV